MLHTYLLCSRVVVAAAVMSFGCGATVAADAPPHTVPTNIPGVYAFTQPPASFNPRSASDEELAAWGYPARPAPTEGPAEWARWEREVDPRVQRVVPVLASRPGVYHRPAQQLVLGPRQSIVNSMAASSENWSGVAIVPNSGQQPYATARANWIVPTVKQPPGTCSGGWNYSSQWVGIDGFNDQYLLQAGSEANAFCDVGENVTEYYPWIEWLPAAEIVIYQSASTSTLYPFAPGDYVTVNVTATNWSGGVSTTGTLQFIDVTQGWGVSLSFTAASLGGSQVTGQSAEWVVERPEVNGVLATLSDYTAEPFTFAWTKDLGAAFHYPNLPGTATVTLITMLDNNAAPVSYVDVVGPQALWLYPEGSATQ